VQAADNRQNPGQTRASRPSPFDSGTLVEIAKTPACHAGDRGSEARTSRHALSNHKASVAQWQSSGLPNRGRRIVTDQTLQRVASPRRLPCPASMERAVRFRGDPRGGNGRTAMRESATLDTPVRLRLASPSPWAASSVQQSVRLTSEGSQEQSLRCPPRRSPGPA
jgi:hypothetical protein